MIEHYAQTIQGWCSFERLYASEVARCSDGAVFCEVGSWLGKSAAFMGTEIINSGKSIRLWCVDTFSGDGADYEEYPAVRDGRQYETFLKNIEPVSTVVKPLRMRSLLAAKELHECDFDFVFLDGDHHYEEIKADLEAWWPRVKPGGHLAGHDYYYAGQGVARAVNEFAQKQKLDKLTLFMQQDCWLLQKPEMPVNVLHAIPAMTTPPTRIFTDAVASIGCKVTTSRMQKA